jgi:hypothetical protein
MMWHPPAPARLQRPWLTKDPEAAVPEVRRQQQRWRRVQRRCGDHVPLRVLGLQEWQPRA